MKKHVNVVKPVWKWMVENKDWGSVISNTTEGIATDFLIGIVHNTGIVSNGQVPGPGTVILSAGEV